MRPIKFRAWIQDDDEKWFMTYDLAFEDYDTINNLLGDIEHLMQFTGLKDKNNIVDVYEGDITIDGVIEFNQDVCGYIIRRSNNTFIRLETRRKTIEIIGNIFETKPQTTNQ